FNVTFFHPVDRTAAANSANWSLQAYTREWGGSYATPDSGRHAVAVTSAGVRENGRQVHLQVDDLKAGYLYDVSAIGQLAENNALWPSEAHYSMKVIPRK
ncbi:MAG: hypothetical protein KDA81_20425, partial [Planctomycetaceae bacterium]|nr:hypothetical protein [Planctomycetaceae bacterium]